MTPSEPCRPASASERAKTKRASYHIRGPAPFFPISFLLPPLPPLPPRGDTLTVLFVLARARVCCGVAESIFSNDE